MVSSLTKKAFRDLWGIRLQVLTVALVVASGIAVLISSWSTYDSLKKAQSVFYTQSRFADVFCDFKPTPSTIVEEQKSISGVLEIEGRLNLEAMLAFPDINEPISGRFISFPDTAETTLNQLYLRNGRLPEGVNEVLVGENFAKAHRLKPQDELNVIINGKLRHLVISGVGTSPEFIYVLRGAAPMPDDFHYGVFWMRHSSLSQMTGQTGLINSLILTTATGINPKQVISELDENLKKAGGLGCYPRADQTSHFFLSDEINQQKVMATLLPTIFLSVSAFLLHIIMGRMTSIQRSQIATLKACGYSNLKITLHYFLVAGLIVTIGAVIGILAGAWLGNQMSILYTDFFHFPILQFTLRPILPISGILISLGAALIGTLNALKSVFQLAPAEAMRPPSPPQYSKGLFEKFMILSQIKSETRMIFRNLALRPFRTFLSIIGISLSSAIMISGTFWQDSLEFILYAQFQKAELYDMMVTFQSPQSADALTEIESIPGVLLAEGYRSIPVRIKYQNHSDLGAVTGLQTKNKLRRIIDRQLNEVVVPEHGILLSTQLAKKLGAKIGDPLEIEIMEGSRDLLTLSLVGLADDFIGAGAYIHANNIPQILKEGPRFTSIALKVDSLYEDEIQQKLRNTPRVAGILSKKGLLKSFNETTAKFIGIFSFILSGFAFLIALGVVYNNARVIFSERTWELATLRIVGFHHLEVFKLLFSEIVALVFISIPAGWALGYGLAWLSVNAIHTEAIQIPLVVEPKSYAIATLVVLLSTVVSAGMILRNVYKLDMVSALKARD
ncbi:MAG: peptide ABC transporter permease [Oligoflexia bacterium]|nr:MAG: peptide ABC transporter permease [Oligoflexia bacterium]